MARPPLTSPVSKNITRKQD